MRSTVPCAAALPAGAAAAITIFLWAGAFPAITLALREIAPIPLAAIRFAIASAVLLGWAIWRRPRLPSGHEWLRVVTCGALGIALYNILLNTGQRSVSPGAASFIVASQPVFAAGLARILLGERLGLRGWIGTVVCLGGVGLVALQQPGGVGHVGGFLVAAAAACSGFYFVLQRPLIARYGPFACATMTVTTGALLLLPWLPSGLKQIIAAPRELVVVLFLSLGAGVIGYIAWMRAIDGLGAARAANLLFLMAPLATILAIPFTHRLPSCLALAGGCVALVGVALVNARPRPGSLTAAT